VRAINSADCNPTTSLGTVCGLVRQNWQRQLHPFKRFAITGPKLDYGSKNILSTPEGILAYLRLFIALDAAIRHLIIQMCGPKIGPGLAEVFEAPEALDGPYGHQLCQMANAVFAGCPQIEELLVQDDWEDTILPLLQQLANAEIDRWLSPGQLAEFHSSLEALADKLSESLESITGDGHSLLEDALEADQGTLAQEPWRLCEAFPLKALGLDSREVSKLADTLGASILGLADQERMDDYAQVLWPHLLQLATDPLAIELPRLRKSSQIWDLLGLEPGSIAPNATTDELAEVVTRLIGSFSQHQHGWLNFQPLRLRGKPTNHTKRRRRHKNNCRQPTKIVDVNHRRSRTGPSSLSSGE
jgi:hypothetical protein